MKSVIKYLGDYTESQITLHIFTSNSKKRKNIMTKELKHINTTLLLEVFGDDKEIICDMIEVFISMSNEYFKDIKDSYALKNWFELGLITHKAKASCKTMGLSDLGNSLDNIENNAKGIAYKELNESRDLTPDKEKLYKAMLREGQQDGDLDIIDNEMKFVIANFEEAVDELTSFKNDIDKHL